MNHFNTVAFALAAALAAAAPAHASLVGASVTGSMQINGGGLNYFDPANGFVPNGFLNKTSGTTVTISTSQTEFGFQDSINFDTVNFTDNGFTLTDISNVGSAPITYKFTSNAFLGLSLTELSDNFLAGGANATLVGNLLTITTANFNAHNGTFTASYSFGSAVPEASTWALMIIGFAGLGFASRRKPVAA
jgi:hypothetical protein